MTGLKKFLTVTDWLLLGGIVFFSVAGILYAAFAGVISLPGIQPVLQADVVGDGPAPLQSPLSVASPTTDGSSMATPDPLASPTADATSSMPTDPIDPVTSSPAVSPSPSPLLSPSPASSSPTPSLTVDQQNEELVMELLAALRTYQRQKKAYPVSASYSVGATHQADTPLKALVESGVVKELPKPATAPTLWIGYLSDGKSCTITLTLEDKRYPGGKYDEQGNYLLYASC